MDPISVSAPMLSSAAAVASSSTTEGAAISTSLHLVLLLLSRSSLLGAIWAVRHILALVICSGLLAILAWWRHPGGPAWGLAARANSHAVAKEIRGPRGWPLVGSLLELMGERPHVRLANLARAHSAKSLMAFSLGTTRVILTSEPSVARELLSSSSFADRPIKQSAKLLLFHRAIGFAPYGDYWRTLRRIAATHLFAPRRLSALEPCRQFETTQLLQSIHAQSGCSFEIRPLLQLTSINNIMKSVFGRRYDFACTQKQALVQVDPEAEQLRRMIREGFELLGAFNWSDHLPFLKWLDLQGVHSRCTKLVAEVQDFVQTIIDEHRARRDHGSGESSVDEADDFVDVLLSLQTSEKLSDTDIIAILWVRNSRRSPLCIT
jgi:cytochrome P450